MTCSIFQRLLIGSTRPVPPITTRSSAYCFSSSVRNLASLIVSGRKKNTTRLQKLVIKPKIYRIEYRVDNAVNPSTHNEHPFPWRERVFDLTDPIGKQRGNEATAAVPCEPDTSSYWGFIACVY
jgi:hypothetical protein